MTKIESLFELQRKKLLDTSYRNPLLNYQLRKSRCIEIESEWPQQVFHCLVNQGKSMTFVEKSEGQNEENYNSTISLDEDLFKDDIDSDHQAKNETNSYDFRVNAPYTNLEDKNVEEELNNTTSPLTIIKNKLIEAYIHLIDSGKLPTIHSQADLDKRKKAIYRDMKKSNKEFGDNPYYLTIGMLEWTDQKRNKSNYSPLLLIPVEIIKENRLAEFKLLCSDTDVEFNEALYEKLFEDFDGIDIPVWNSIDYPDVHNYLRDLATVVEKHGWKVHYKKMALTYFASGKYLMQRDLKYESWPKNHLPEKNKTFKKLLYKESKKKWKPILEETHLIDSIISLSGNYQIYDADSSQLTAIHYVNEEHDLIIQGPPGTGKSQTITNILAQAISKEKKVLFVAQKETAINVVKSRFDDAGLGQLCLMLHSNKMKRSDFLYDIEQTLNYPPIVADNNFDTLSRLETIRDKINNFSETLNSPHESKTLTPFYCLDEILKLKNSLHEANPPRWPRRDIFEKIDTLGFQEWLPKIKHLQRLLGEIGPPQNNVFKHCKLNEDTFIAPEQTIQIIKLVHHQC